MIPANNTAFLYHILLTGYDVFEADLLDDLGLGSRANMLCLRQRSSASLISYHIFVFT